MVRRHLIGAALGTILLATTAGAGFAHGVGSTTLEQSPRIRSLLESEGETDEARGNEANLLAGRYRYYGRRYSYRPYYTYPPAYRTYRPYYTYPPVYRTYRPYYRYPPAYRTYRPYYTYPPAYRRYYYPGGFYGGFYFSF